ncbi:MAG: alpha/beta hydrolase [Patescibacteria group bacterium]
MQNIFIIHGAYGNPGENWFPWLKNELKKLGENVFIPKFPTPKNQSLENWLNILAKYKQYFNSETIIVGHSIGVGFLLNVIENLKNPIKSAFFISGWVGELNNPKFDEINKTFVNRNFNWSKIQKNCKKFHVFNSDNDPYVPLELGKSLANYLRTNLIIIKNGGHINSEAEFTKFEYLLEEIKKELK